MRRPVAIVLAVVVILTAVLLYLFRRSTEVDPRYGEVTYVWRWGIASHMNADRNRDSRVDLVVTWNEGREFVTSFPPRELRADTNFDGRFDLHVQYAPVRLVELERNEDGVFETTYRDAAADDYLSRLSFGVRQ